MARKEKVIHVIPISGSTSVTRVKAGTPLSYPLRVWLSPSQSPRRMPRIGETVDTFVDGGTTYAVGVRKRGSKVRRKKVRKTFREGDRVISIDDGDEGVVHEVDNEMKLAYVGWKSGITTQAPFEYIEHK